MRLASFAKFVPEGRKTVAEIVTSSGASAAEAKAFGRLFGFDRVAVTDNTASVADTFHHVLDTMMAADAALPDTLIYVHGNPAQYDMTAHPVDALLASHPMLAQVQDWFEMDQQNCSTLFWGLDAAQRLLEGDARRVLVLAGDNLSQMPVDDRYAPGVTAIGDAYVGLMLDAEKGGTQIGDIFLKTHSDFYAGRFGTARQSASFNATHGDLVREILDATDFDADSTAPILPHNVNRLSWTQFSRETGMDRDRIWLDLLPDVGHCYTVDAATMIDRFMTSVEQSAHLLSVGQGGFLGGCKITKEMATCK